MLVHIWLHTPKDNCNDIFKSIHPVLNVSSQCPNVNLSSDNNNKSIKVCQLLVALFQKIF